MAVHVGLVLICVVPLIYRLKCIIIYINYNYALTRRLYRMFKKNLQLIICIASAATAAVALVLFYIFKPVTGNDVVDTLVSGIVPRAIVGAVSIIFLCLSGLQFILIPDLKRLGKNLAWCIPCMLVVIANFPFTALISGSASIVHTDLIWLFAVDCLCVGIMEEALFRGLVHWTVMRYVKDKKRKNFLTVLITSALFALFHLLNLFSGASAGATLMQVGYSFLIGAMLSAVMIKTQSLWFCAALHALFNFGGNIVYYLGQGAFQDLFFWIFTAVAAVICCVHVVYFLFKDDLIKFKKK